MAGSFNRHHLITGPTRGFRTAWLGSELVWERDYYQVLVSVAGGLFRESSPTASIQIAGNSERNLRIYPCGIQLAVP